jgi:maleamate amidohydrolase
MNSRSEDVYADQGFGQDLEIVSPLALLVVDFQNGFVDPAVFGGGNAAEAAAKAKGLLALAREHGWPVAYSRCVYADDRSDANVFTEKIPSSYVLTENAPESQIVDSLAPMEGELVVRKQFPSAFFGTTLASWLARQGVKTVVVAGATTSGCIRASVVDAMCHGFIPLVVEDCVGDRSVAQHDANLFDMKMKYAAVKTFDEMKELDAVKQ